MQTTIAAVLVIGGVTGNVSVIVNSSLALLVTFLPAYLERDHDITLDPTLSLWITTPVLLHSFGMVGLYSTVWWWDHVTHTLSATLVAGVGYTTARALDVHSGAIQLPPKFLFVYVLLFTIAFGVIWEVFEFGARLLAVSLGMAPILVQYGLEDTIMDLVFDIVGAIIVAAFGTARLAGTVDLVVERLTAGHEK